MEAAGGRDKTTALGGARESTDRQSEGAVVVGVPPVKRAGNALPYVKLDDRPKLRECPAVLITEKVPPELPGALTQGFLTLARLLLLFHVH
jgi:hypothetical protein